MEDEKILNFAKSLGYDSVEYLKKWKGYRCYEPIMECENGSISFTGLPLVILVKGSEIRMSTADEAVKI